MARRFDVDEVMEEANEEPQTGEKRRLSPGEEVAQKRSRTIAASQQIHAVERQRRVDALLREAARRALIRQREEEMEDRREQAAYDLERYRRTVLREANLRTYTSQFGGDGPNDVYRRNKLFG